MSVESEKNRTIAPFVAQNLLAVKCVTGGKMLAFVTQLRGLTTECF